MNCKEKNKEKVNDTNGEKKTRNQKKKQQQQWYRRNTSEFQYSTCMKILFEHIKQAFTQVSELYEDTTLKP